MSLEQRLQHAARDLRGVEIPVPPLGGADVSARARPRRLQMVAVPVLFVVGGLMAVNGVRQDVTPTPFDSDIVDQIETTETPVAEAPTRPEQQQRSTGPTDVQRADVEPNEVAPTDALPAAPNARAEMDIIAEVRNRQRLAEVGESGESATTGESSDVDPAELGSANEVVPNDPGPRLANVDTFGPI